jgi:hypothetical protein
MSLFFQFFFFFHPCPWQPSEKYDKERRLFLQVKVIHAFKKLEEINRDLIELSKLSERIAEDRDYSEFLKESFQMEIKKLTSNREDILNLKVENPHSSNKILSTSNLQQEGKKLYDEQESSYRDEKISEQTEIPTKKEIKKKPERPIYKY